MKYKNLQDLLSNKLLNKDDVFTSRDIMELIKYNFLISGYDLKVNDKDVISVNVDVLHGIINFEV